MIQEKTLENGLEIIVQKMNSPVVTVQYWVDVGSIDEKPEEAGFCHFLEHMLFKGTSKLSTQQIAGSVESAGGEMNAFTSFEYTAYHITLPVSQLNLALDTLTAMVADSVFLKQEFTPEKEVILEEIKRGEDSPGRQLYQGHYATYWKNGHYGRPVIGYPKTVSACSASQLKSFWKKWYSPRLMTLVVVGDVDSMTIMKRIEVLWQKYKTPNKAPRERRRLDNRQKLASLKMSPASQRSMCKTRNFDVQLNYWTASFPGISLGDRQVPALDLASYVLGSGESSRLHQKLFDADHSVQSVHAGSWTPYYSGLFSFEVQTSTKQMFAFREAFVEVIKDFALHGPTTQELERAKIAIESEKSFGAQSVDSIAYRLGQYKLLTGNIYFEDGYNSSLLELTVEDVRNAFASVCDFNAFHEFALVPKAIGQVALTPFNQLTSEKRVNLLKKSESPRRVDLGSVELLLFKKDDLPIVYWQGALKGGQRSESAQNIGLGQLMSLVVDKGPQGMNAAEYSERQDQLAMSMSVYSGRSSYGFTARSLSKTFESALDLSLDAFYRPRFAEQDFSKMKTLQLEQIKSLEDQPGRLVEAMFCQLAFGQHPYGLPIVGRTEIIETVSLQGLKSHWQKIVDQKITIGVVGRFSEDFLIGRFEKVAKNLQHTKTTMNQIYGDYTLKEPGADSRLSVEKNREQSHIIVGYRGLAINDHRRFQLKLLNSLLSGQGGPLFRELRDKQGLCYVVAPMIFEGVDTGYFGVYMGCDPVKRKTAIEGIGKLLNSYRKRGFSAAEVEKSKRYLLGRHLIDLQSYASQSSSMVLGSLYGMGVDEFMRWPDQIKKITAKDVTKLLNELMSQQQFITEVI